MAKFVIKYRGVLTEMYVTGFSEPIEQADGERSVKASNLIADAMVFDESAIDEAMRLTNRCQAGARKVDV